MVVRILVGLALATSLAVPAVAQQAPTPPRLSRSPAELDRHMGNIRHAQQAEFEAFRDQSTGNNLSQPLERVDLANRVSGLIQLGRCEEARTLAREAGDRLMSVRARQLCRAQRN